MHTIFSLQHHLKKLEGRRLDYDYKKKRQGKIPEEEIRQALEKFDESKDVAETSMYNLLETDVSVVSKDLLLLCFHICTCLYLFLGLNNLEIARLYNVIRVLFHTSLYVEVSW